MTEIEGVDPALLAVLQDVYGELVRFVEQILRKGQAAGEIREDLDPGLTSFAIVGMLRGTGCSRPISERMKVDYPAMMKTLKMVLIEELRP